MSDYDIVMPWGKHKGTKMGELPRGYLRWLAENISEDTPSNKMICLAADRLYQSGEGEEDEDQ